MSFGRKYLPPLLAIGLGIANGFYVFKPSIEEQKEDAIQSTIRPQNPPPSSSTPPQTQDAAASSSPK